MTGFHSAKEILSFFSLRTIDCPINTSDSPDRLIRLHCPSVSSKTEDTENCQFTLLPTKKQLRLFFAQLFLQISLYEQSQTCVTNVNPFTVDHCNLKKVIRQSIVLNEIKTEVLLENDDPENKNFLLQRYKERIERLSQTNKVGKFCMDARFLRVVEIGQCFMTKDNGEQIFARTCREYTLPRDDGSSQPRGWIHKKHKNWTRAGSYNQLLAR